MRKKKTTEQFIEDAVKVHGCKYDYSKTKYNKSSEKVCIVCPKHGEFWQEANSHLQGRGCPKCGNNNISEHLKSNTNNFIRQSNKIHSNKYDYSKVKYINSHTKVCIICPIHGEFWQRPNDHLRGCGCPICSLKLINNKTLTNGEFIEKAKMVHGNKYDYSKVEYENNRTKVCIICPIHGEFWQKPNDHLNGHGCSKCSGTKALTTEEFIENARKIHGDKYDYSKVEYMGNKKKVCIICLKHGEFWVRPNSHLSQKQGCKHCKKSKMENEIMSILKNNNISYVYQYNNKNCDWLGRQSLDFYLPQYNIAIECQGEQHYKSVKLWGGEMGFKRRNKLDEIKKEKCKKHGIKIIYVGEDSYAKKYNIVSLTEFSEHIVNNLLKI